MVIYGTLNKLKLKLKLKFSIFFYLVYWWFWWKVDPCSHHIFNKILITRTNQLSDSSTGILACLLPCVFRKRVDVKGRKKSKKRHLNVSKFSFMCVCPLDIYTDTNVKPISRCSCDSRISIDKRHVHTSLAENVCVECGCVSNAAWGAWSSNITRTKWKTLKFKARLTSFWPMETVFCAVFELLTYILVNI